MLYYQHKKSYLCTFMKKGVVLLSIISFLILFSSCKTEFEKIRSSGDFELMFEKAQKYYEEEEWLKAQTLYEQVLGNLRGKVEAEEVYFKYAFTHYHLRKYILASYYFRNFSSTFTASDLKEEAQFMTAYSNYKLSPSFRLDQKSTDDAIDGFQQFVNAFPGSERVDECNKLIDELRRKLEEKAYSEGQLYFDLRQFESSKHSFENLLKDFPETPDAEKVRFMIVQSSYMLAENSIFTRQVERFEKMLTDADLFKAKYPRSEFVSEVRSMENKAKKRIKELTK